MRLRTSRAWAIGVGVACTAILALGVTVITEAGAAASTTLTLQPVQGLPGSVVHVSGSGYTPGDTVDLTWQQVTGSWDVTTNGDFVGANYSPSNVKVASAVVSSTGSLSASFQVPTGFGFTHNVDVTDAGQTVGTADFKVLMSASISPREGPVGTPIHIKVAGIGFAEYHQSWLLNYDNHLTGWISAVTTEGTANFTIPATGAPGLHMLAIYPGADRSPYLNTQQAPTGNEYFNFAFTVTSGSPVLPPSMVVQTPAVVTAVPLATAQSGPAASVDPVAGPPSTLVTLEGSGFPADQSAQVTWQTQVGSHITTLTTVELPMATTETDASGGLSATFKVPSDMGDSHVVTVQVGSTSATTSFFVSPLDLGITPSSGKVGTSLTIHLEGTGETWTSNVFGVVFDNSNIGYVCGLNTGGDITLHLKATGTPGWNLIDLYPEVWQIEGLQFAVADYFQIPQLTYSTDHPGGSVPEFQFAFYLKN